VVVTADRTATMRQDARMGASDPVRADRAGAPNRADWNNRWMRWRGERKKESRTSADVSARAAIPRRSTARAWALVRAAQWWLTPKPHVPRGRGLMWGPMWPGSPATTNGARKSRQSQTQALRHKSPKAGARLLGWPAFPGYPVRRNHAA